MDVSKFDMKTLELGTPKRGSNSTLTLYANDCPRFISGPLQAAWPIKPFNEQSADMDFEVRALDDKLLDFFSRLECVLATKLYFQRYACFGNDSVIKLRSPDDVPLKELVRLDEKYGDSMRSKIVGWNGAWTALDKSNRGFVERVRWDRSYKPQDGATEFFFKLSDGKYRVGGPWDCEKGTSVKIEFKLSRVYISKGHANAVIQATRVFVEGGSKSESTIEKAPLPDWAVLADVIDA